MARLRFALLAALAGLVACGPSTPPYITIDPAMVTLIPPDTVALFGVRIDHLRETPVFEKLFAKGRIPGLQRFIDRTGVAPDNLWELLAVYDGTSVALLARGKFSESGMEPRLEWEGSTRGSYKGYLFVSDADAAVSFMNSSTVIAGPPDRVRAIVDLREKSPGAPAALMEMLKTIDRSNQVWAVATGGFTRAVPPPPGYLANLDRMLRKLRTLKVTGNFHDGLIFNAVGECATPEDAETLQSALRAMQGLARLGLREEPALLTALDTIGIGRRETVVEVDATVPAELLSKILAEKTSSRNQ